MNCRNAEIGNTGGHKWKKWLKEKLSYTGVTHKAPTALVHFECSRAYPSFGVVFGQVKRVNGMPVAGK